MSTALEERYSLATRTSDLTTRLDRRCDADVLLAAGFAAQGDPRNALALEVYRFIATRDLANVGPIAEKLADLLQRRISRPVRGQRLARRQRVELVDCARSVLYWHLLKTCDKCAGRGYLLQPGTQLIDPRRPCRKCSGTGQRPLDVGERMREHGDYLAERVETMLGFVFSEMAKRLRPSLDL